jgi:hypothetical protein
MPELNDDGKQMTPHEYAEKHPEVGNGSAPVEEVAGDAPQLVDSPTDETETVEEEQ